MHPRPDQVRPEAPELRFLLALSRLDMPPAQLEWCRSLLREHRDSFDWGLFIDQAGRHKVLSLVGRHIVTARLYHSPKGPPLIPYWWIYPAAYDANRIRGEAQAEEYGSLLAELSDEGISYAVRKGPAIGELLYKDAGLRRMNDLDILVPREDVHAVADVLHRRGYRQGELSQDGSTVVPFKRATRAFWRMHVNNDLPFLKASPRPDIGAFAVDICLDLLQPNAHGGLPVPLLIERRLPTRLYGRESYTLSIEDQFIDLCLHFHKEATSLFYIRSGVDLRLMKFLDVALMCRYLTEHGKWMDAIERARRSETIDSVFYAVSYTLMVYPDAVSAAQFEDIGTVDPAILDVYGQFDGRLERWEAALLDRLFSWDRRQTALALPQSSIPFDIEGDCDSD